MLSQFKLRNRQSSSIVPTIIGPPDRAARNLTSLANLATNQIDLSALKTRRKELKASAQFGDFSDFDDHVSYEHDSVGYDHGTGGVGYHHEGQSPVGYDHGDNNVKFDSGLKAKSRSHGKGHGSYDYHDYHSGYGHSGHSGKGHSGYGHSGKGHSGYGHSGHKGHKDHSGYGHSGHSGYGHSGHKGHKDHKGHSGYGHSGHKGHSGHGHSGHKDHKGHSGYGHSGHSGYGHHGKSHKVDCCPIVVDPLVLTGILGAIAAGTAFFNTLITMNITKKRRRRRRREGVEEEETYAWSRWSLESLELAIKGVTFINILFNNL